MNEPTIVQTLDERGKTITTAVVFAATGRLAGLAEGEVLELLTDDFEPFEPEVTTWCQVTGHSLLRFERGPAGYRFLIAKGSPRPTASTLALVVSEEDREELLSPLGFALAAALEGIEVHVYLQGPAVRILQEGFRPRLRGWARPFSRFAAAGFARRGHVPAQDKLRQLHSLGARLYACASSIEHFKVDTSRLIIDDVALVEYLTFMAVMGRADIQLYS